MESIFNLKDSDSSLYSNRVLRGKKARQTLQIASSADSARAGCRCLQKPMKGLFFHPNHRRFLTSVSMLEGWQYYSNVQYRDMNVESKAEGFSGYLGLSPLYFAARCALCAARTLQNGAAFASVPAATASSAAAVPPSDGCSLTLQPECPHLVSLVCCYLPCNDYLLQQPAADNTAI